MLFTFCRSCSDDCYVDFIWWSISDEKKSGLSVKFKLRHRRVVFGTENKDGVEIKEGERVRKTNCWIVAHLELLSRDSATTAAVRCAMEVCRRPGGPIWFVVAHYTLISGRIQCDAVTDVTNFDDFPTLAVQSRSLTRGRGSTRNGHTCGQSSSVHRSFAWERADIFFSYWLKTSERWNIKSSTGGHIIDAMEIMHKFAPQHWTPFPHKGVPYAPRPVTSFVESYIYFFFFFIHDFTDLRIFISWRLLKRRYYPYERGSFTRKERHNFQAFFLASLHAIGSLSLDDYRCLCAVILLLLNGRNFTRMVPEYQLKGSCTQFATATSRPGGVLEHPYGLDTALVAAQEGHCQGTWQADGRAALRNNRVTGVRRSSHKLHRPGGSRPRPLRAA